MWNPRLKNEKNECNEKSEKKSLFCHTVELKLFRAIPEIKYGATKRIATFTWFVWKLLMEQQII